MLTQASPVAQPGTDGIPFCAGTALQILMHTPVEPWVGKHSRPVAHWVAVVACEKSRVQDPFSATVPGGRHTLIGTGRSPRS